MSSLRAPAAPEDASVQEDADVVAVADLEAFRLIPVGFDRGAGVEHLHPRLRLQTGRKVALERHHRVRRFAVAVENHEPGRLRFHLLPRDAADLVGRGTRDLVRR